jgi:predicted phosphodiesterase
MKFLVLSDLHLEFTRNADFLPDPDAVAAADLIVLAGDIHSGTLGIDWAGRHFPHRAVVYIAGNHEYYDHELIGTTDALRAAAARTTNVRFLDNDTLLLGAVRIVGATLWTDFDLFGRSNRDQCEGIAAEFINDFRLIRVARSALPADAAPLALEAGDGEAAMPPDQGAFTPALSIELHARARAFIDAELARPHAGPTVVVTHHLPSAASVAERFRTNATSAAFASHLDPLITRHRPQLWIHGHTHDSFDYRLDATRVVCNPMGYPARQSGAKENAAFDAGLLVEI